MTDAELIDMLRNNVGVSEAACRAAKAAADRIEQLVAEKAIPTFDPAAIREQALREAAHVALNMNNGETAKAIHRAILALIGEKK